MTAATATAIAALRETGVDAPTEAEIAAWLAGHRYARDHAHRFAYGLVPDPTPRR